MPSSTYSGSPWRTKMTLLSDLRLHPLKNMLLRHFKTWKDTDNIMLDHRSPIETSSKSQSEIFLLLLYLSPPECNVICISRIIFTQKACDCANVQVNWNILWCTSGCMSRRIRIREENHLNENVVRVMTDGRNFGTRQQWSEEVQLPTMMIHVYYTWIIIVGKKPRLPPWIWWRHFIREGGVGKSIHIPDPRHVPRASTVKEILSFIIIL